MQHEDWCAIKPTNHKEFHHAPTQYRTIPLVCTNTSPSETTVKKHKNEAKLLKKALELGFAFAKKQGFADLDKSVPSTDRVECIYRLLVQAKQITPLAVDQEDGPNMKHKLVLWISRLLPPDHELLK
ncbi:DUF5062 family protein [Photobacterium ganghwense]|nr:DUF5062 family protein [Photobacterium ganghwense]